MQQLSIPVANIATLLGLGYTRIEVWYSRDQGLTWNEITSSAAGHGQLTSLPASTTFNMGGHTLKVLTNGGAVSTITFDSLLQQWTPTQVANRINEVVTGLAGVSMDGKSVVLTSSTTGRNSSVQIAYNDATDLGFSAGDTGLGTDVRVLLVPGTLVYPYSDVAGTNGDLYKWRFSADGASPVSDFSKPVPGFPPPLTGVPLSIATAFFCDLTGQPVKRTIVIAQNSTPMSVSGAGVGSEVPLLVSSDDNGFLQVSLVQGAKIRVGIEGTAYVREITVPTSATFDLLDALADAPDPFTVQVPPPFLIRRSL